MRRILFGLGLACAVVSAATIRAAGPADAAFEAFWHAATPAAAEKMSGGIVAANVSFDEAIRRLKAGRTYRKEPGGVFRHATSVGGVPVVNLIEIPPEYDPSRKW